MRILNKKFVIVLASIALHTVFVILSYDAELLSELSTIVNPLIIHRALLLLQFIPLIVVINSHVLLRDKSLLFLAFSIYVNTIFIVNDFASGFYGSISDYKSGLMPRMRASAHLMAYEDTGRIVVLDYHAEYFLEYIVTHFLSEITGMNYVLIYALPVRLLHIALWGLVFILTCSSVLSKNPSRLWLLLIIGSFFVANNGYNYEVSFAALALIIFFLLLNKERKRAHAVGVILMIMAVLFASFRETLILTIMSMVALAINFIYIARSRLQTSTPKIPSQTFILMITVIGLARTLIFSTTYYFEWYANALFSLIRSIQQALIEGLTIEKEVLITTLMVKNPVDRAIDMTAAISMISLLTVLALLSLFYIICHRPTNLLLTATLVSYILVYAISVMQYSVNLTLGYGFDFGSSTALARSLAPLVALIFAYYPFNTHIRSKGVKGKLLTYTILFLLSIIVMFAPLTFMARGEIKSSYDELRIEGPTELVIGCNGLYRFIVTHKIQSSLISIPSDRFLQLYYLLPLTYKTGGLVRFEFMPKMETNNIIYNNRISQPLYIKT